MNECNVAQSTQLDMLYRTLGTPPQIGLNIQVDFIFEVPRTHKLCSHRRSDTPGQCVGAPSLRNSSQIHQCSLVWSDRSTGRPEEFFVEIQQYQVWKCMLVRSTRSPERSANTHTQMFSTQTEPYTSEQSGITPGPFQQFTLQIPEANMIVYPKHDHTLY